MAKESVRVRFGLSQTVLGTMNSHMPPSQTLRSSGCQGSPLPCRPSTSLALRTASRQLFVKGFICFFQLEDSIRRMLGFVWPCGSAFWGVGFKK